nr:C-type lectin domain family 2 member D-like [Pogona vitticeps]
MSAVHRQCWKFAVDKKKLIYCGGFIIVLVVIVVVTVFLTKHFGPSCAFSSPCPPLWIMFEGKCYYFSKEGKNWTSSQTFCSSYGASLARITTNEKDFIMWLKGKTPYWIGLGRDRDQSWKWINGENATLEVIGNGGDCAYLVDDFKASSSRCNTEHSWICQRPVEAAGPAIERKADGVQLSRQHDPVDGIRTH